MLQDKFVLQCSWGLLTLKLHLLDYLTNDSKRLGSSLITNAGSLEHSCVHINKSHKMKSLRLLTESHKTAENMTSAMDIVQRPDTEIEGVLLAHLE